MLILSVFLSVVDFYCFDSDFYSEEYTKLNTAEDIGVSQDDLDLMTDDLLDYLKDYRDNLDLEVSVKGQVRQAYNERETIHMADVKELYQSVLAIRNISLIISIILFVIMIYTKSLAGINKAYIKILLLYGFIFGFIGLMCLIDFDSFWISFHKLFFTKNDYWLLDPKTSLLINMVPSQFFFDLCIRIIITIVVLICLMYFIFRYLNKKVSK